MVLRLIEAKNTAIASVTASIFNVYVVVPAEKIKYLFNEVNRGWEASLKKIGLYTSLIFKFGIIIQTA